MQKRNLVKLVYYAEYLNKQPCCIPTVNNKGAIFQYGSNIFNLVQEEMIIRRYGSYNNQYKLN